MNAKTLSLCLSLTALLASAASSAEPRTVDLAIERVTVIDPASGTVAEERTVLVDEGRILAVVPAAQAAAYAPTQRLAGDGRYLIPGLLDMHAHVAHPMFSRNTLELMLAHGVTGVREMSGDCWEPRGEIFACIDEYRQLQAAIEAGQVPAPRLLRIASAPVRGPAERHPPHVPEGAPAWVTPADAAEARRVVAHLDQRGVDMVKTYGGLSREAYLALLTAAAEAELEVVGHIPASVAVAEAVNGGHRSIEHARALVYACGGVDTVTTPELERMRAAVEGFDEQRCEALLATMAAAGTWYVPTHITREMEARATEDAYREDERLAYIDSRLRGFWQEDLARTAGRGEAAAATYRAFFQLGLRITGMAQAAGVGVLAGTDSNDTMAFPGASLHDELAHLVAAGLSPLQALRAATSDAARYLGREQALGRIAAGAHADLVLLEADPLTDIHNSRGVAATILGGRVYDSATLDGMLAGVRERATAPWWAGIEIVSLEATALQRLEGRYRVPSSGLEIAITAADGTLRAAAEGMPVITFYPESATLFFMKEDQTRFRFVVERGEVTGLEVIWSNGRSELAPREG